MRDHIRLRFKRGLPEPGRVAERSARSSVSPSKTVKFHLTNIYRKLGMVEPHGGDALRVGARDHGSLVARSRLILPRERPDELDDAVDRIAFRAERFEHHSPA